MNPKIPIELSTAWRNRVRMLKDAQALQEKADRLYAADKRVFADELRKSSTSMTLKAERDFKDVLKKLYGSLYRIEKHALDRWTVWIRPPYNKEAETPILLTKTTKPPPTKPRPEVPGSFREAVMQARAKLYPKH